MHFIGKIRDIFRPKYDTLNRVDILASNILANYELLKKTGEGKSIIPVLKSNAYGHGIKEMCQILAKTDCPMVAVDSFPEAQIAYHYFPRKVLIIGEMPISAYKYTDFKRTEFCVYNSHTFQYLAS
nr:alanine racemase [Candidatus Gracilibacteria bacterium]